MNSINAKMDPLSNQQQPDKIQKEAASMLFIKSNIDALLRIIVEKEQSLWEALKQAAIKHINEAGSNESNKNDVQSSNIHASSTKNPDPTTVSSIPANQASINQEKSLSSFSIPCAIY